MKQISTIYFEALANGVHFALAKRLLDAALADEKVSEKAATQLAKLQTAFEQEDADLKLSRKSFDTDKLEKADKRQDKLFLTLKRAVKGFLDDSDEEIAEAAKVLNQLFVDYAISTKAQFDREAGLVYNICTDFNEKYADHVATLGLAVMVKRLTEANAEVLSLLSSRSMERSTKVAGALKKSRAAVDTALRELVQYVNAAAVIFGIDDYESYIDFANTEITRIKREALGQKASTSSSDDTTDNVADSTDTPAGDTDSSTGDSGSSSDSGSTDSGSGSTDSEGDI